MFVSPRIRLKPLCQLCHRLALSTRAGIEDRKIWQDEAYRGSRSQRSKVGLVRDTLATGTSLTDALPATGKYFPPLFRQMLEVGETSGQLGRTYQRLAEHYDRTLAARRAFLGTLAWPLLQMGMALAVIGLLIYILGMLPANRSAAGPQADILGGGLLGTRGLIIYVNVLVVVGIVLLLALEAARRGMFWSRQLQRLALRIPIIGGALKTLALARFTWALQLVLDTPMDLRRALPLALEAAGNEHYARHGPAVVEQIQAGQPIQTALAATGVFPLEFLDAVAVGEESGSLVEAMQRQSAEYQERSVLAIGILAQIAGYGVWLLIAVFITMMIFQLFSFYVDTIKSFT